MTAPGRWSGALALALALGAASVGAQEVLAAREREARGLHRGIAASEVRSSVPGGTAIGWGIEFDGRAPSARLDLVLPLGGSTQAEPLQALLARAGAASGIALAVEGGALPGGLLVDGGRILSWPQQGPVLLAEAEGSFRILDPPGGDAGEAFALLSDGTRVPIASVGGAPAEGMAVAIAGPWTATGEFLAAHPADSLLVALAPAPGNRSGGRAWWDADLPLGERAFAPSPPVPLAGAALRPGEAALVVARNDSLAGFLAESLTVVLSVPLAPEIGNARFAFELGGPVFAEDGGWLLDEEPGAMDPLLLLGVSPDGRRVLLAQSGDAPRGRFGLRAGDLASWLQDLGIANAHRLGAGDRRLLLDMGDGQWIADAGNTRTRLALAAVPAAPVLRGPGGTEWARVPALSATGSPTGSPSARNRPAALVDGIQAPHPEARGYWSAALPPGAQLPLPGQRGSRDLLQWFEVSHGQPRLVGAVDLLHAEHAGFSPDFNLKSYRVFVRARRGDAWRLVRTVERDAPIRRERLVFDPPVLVEEWRVEVLEPNFLPGGETARLSEIVFWGPPPSR